MLQQILLTTIVLPLVLGVLISIAGNGSSSARLAIAAFAIPVAAAVVSMAIEGLPPLPPVAAKQKFPLLLIGAGLVFAILSFVLKQGLGRLSAIILAAISLAIPAWWLGRNVLAANPTKATTLAIVLVILAVLLALFSANRDGQTRQSAPAALPAALLWTAIASALAAIFGGYIGMAQMNGGLAALFGGWLLVRYVSYMRGSDDAFALTGIAAFAAIWTAAVSLAMTVLFAPSAAPAALILAALPLAVAYALQARGIGFVGQPRFLRPLASGVITAIPAICAILIAAMLQA
ncbi:hypothetical protein LJR030_004355 [Rhizobium sp. LjRoot30]|uniref:hypothetical protein n=1 Tax=Rhizobium sp. LjRoot30 TaxID=3342320 RepID=UPI003ECE7779